MLLRDLTIENFRSFDKYRLNGLARVNLLVGDNNCGKTSVLEAVHFLVSRGAFGCLFESFANRGCSKGAPNGERELSLDEEDLSALFCRDSHRSNDLTKRVMRIITSSEPDAEFRLVLELLPDLSPRELVSEVVSGRTVHRREVMLLPRPVLPDQRTVKPTAELKHRSATTLGIAPAHFFIPTRGVSVSRLSSQWDQLVDRGNAQFVEQAIQIIDPRLKRVHFSQNAKSTSRVSVERDGIRIRFSELGDGVSALLTIGIGISSSSHGIFLVDEIDTGLHYSHLSNMWRTVIRTAEQLDVQVFATTHSLDCLNGLQDAIAAEPDLAEHVAVHRIERAIEKAVSLSGEEFARAMLRESEIR